MPKSQTSRSTPKLSDLAKHVVAPSGVVSTGWPPVAVKCLELGIRFRTWQPDVGRLILAKRADGKYAATIGGTGLSIPRQVGKTFLVGAIVFALCLLRPKLTVIWTAHRLRTSEETFKKMLAMSRRGRIAPHMLRPVLGSGEEAIMFRNGSRILFGARERGFGRGFDEVDVLIFDEAQILSENALDDMVPATNQSRQETSALLLFMGTPPKPTDPGDVFSRMRAEALADGGGDTGWVEFGADDDFVATEEPSPLKAADWAQVVKANPSYPQDTPKEAILRMRKQLGPEAFLREGLGIWYVASSTDGDLDLAKWLELADAHAPRGTRPVFGVDIGEDRLAHVAVAWRRPDRHLQVMLADTNLSPLETPGRLSELAAAWKGAVMLGGPAAALDGEVKRSKVMSAAEFAAACGRFDDLLQAGKLHHGNQDPLNEAVRAACWRRVGSAGERALQLRDAPAVGPLAAAVRALGGLTKTRPPAKPMVVAAPRQVAPEKSVAKINF